MADVPVRVHHSEDEEMSMHVDVDEEELILDTAYENSLNFLEVWKSCGSVKKFLERDQYISVRGTSVGRVEAAESLRIDKDVDGVVIEWLDIGKGLESEFSHMQFNASENLLRGIFSMLKKHLDLTEYSEKSLKVLRASVGCQLMYDGGWETWFGVIPSKSQTFMYDMNDQKRIVMATMERLKCVFKDELKDFIKRRIALKTLAKNNLNEFTKLFILPDDRRSILQAFQRALDKVDLARGFEKIVFTFRFGEKSSKPVHLPIAEYSAVRDISVHVGCTLASDEYDLFWSRNGLQEIVGTRGVITTALSFTECGNFQSNLDGRRIDISTALRSIVSVENVRFVQLYSDVAHKYPNSRMHPVTASVIMLKGLGNALVEQSLHRDARNYLSTINSNFMQFTDGICRLEIVCSGVKETVAVADLIDEDRLINLLEQHPLIVPYMKELRLMEKLQAVGVDLHDRLQTAYSTRRGTGDIESIWFSYQSELAVEKLLWGHPLCSTSRIFSINLGPGVEYPSRSLSDQMGFLCLNHVFACCSSEDSVPPLSIFSRNVNVQRQLRDVSGIVNLKGASTTLLGRKVILCLLKDFYVTGGVLSRENDYMLMLKTTAGNEGKYIVGRITVTDLTSRLTSRVKTRFPMAFESVMDLIRNGSIDIETALKNGIIDLGLGYFPAFRLYDQNRHAYINWKFNFGFWVISDVSDIDKCTAGEAAEMHSLVLTEMEKLKLCHTSIYREMLFPWLKPVLLKIAERKLTVHEKVKILTFVSCLALYQMGRYVNFRSMPKLVENLPLGQRSLIDLEVQSRFLVYGVTTVRLHRLHPSIPWKIDEKGSAQKKKSSQDLSEHALVPEKYHEGVTERVSEENQIELSVTAIEPVAVRHYATSRGGKIWSQRELAVLMEVADVAGKTSFEKYQIYQKRCHEEDIPDRSYAAFKRKHQRFHRQDIYHGPN